MKYLKTYNESNFIDWGDSNTNIGIRIVDKPRQFQKILTELNFTWINGAKFNNHVPSDTSVIYILMENGVFYWMREDLGGGSDNVKLEDYVKNIISEKEFLKRYDMEEWKDANKLGLY